VCLDDRLSIAAPDSVADRVEQVPCAPKTDRILHGFRLRDQQNADNESSGAAFDKQLLRTRTGNCFCQTTSL